MFVVVVVFDELIEISLTAYAGVGMILTGEVINTDLTPISGPYLQFGSGYPLLL